MHAGEKGFFFLKLECVIRVSISFYQTFHRKTKNLLGSEEEVL